MSKWKLLVTFFVCILLVMGLFPLLSSQINSLTVQPVFSQRSLEVAQEIDSLINPESLNLTSTNSSNAPAPKPMPTAFLTPSTPKMVIGVSSSASYGVNEVSASPTPTPMPTPMSTPMPVDNSRELQEAINALGKTGGEIVLESDLFLSAIDVSVTSNVVLSGVDSSVTLHLISKRLNVAVNASNVVIKNLTIDASYLGDRNVLAVYLGARNVTLSNVKFQNHFANRSAVTSLGSYVTLSNLAFSNVGKAFPIQVASSHTKVSNCSSNDSSTYALVTMGGGISNVTIERCIVQNRPLFNGGYTRASSSDLWIVNNTLNNFPKWTYGILLEGGTNEPIRAPFNRVYVLDNKIKAGFLSFNAIAIYGLSSNILVVNNTVDQFLSGHNAIGIASGVNVTVTENTVYGCVESAEGGIEVESNPVHNRLIGISENVTVTKNLVFNSFWGIYVRVMSPAHQNWASTPLISKNILIEGNMVYNCSVGVNLLHGDSIIVRDNNIGDNIRPFVVDPLNVFNFSVRGNVGHDDYLP